MTALNGLNVNTEKSLYSLIPPPMVLSSRVSAATKTHVKIKENDTPGFDGVAGMFLCCLTLTLEDISLLQLLCGGSLAQPPAG